MTSQRNDEAYYDYSHDGNTYFELGNVTSSLENLGQPQTKNVEITTNFVQPETNQVENPAENQAAMPAAIQTESPPSQASQCPPSQSVDTEQANENDIYNSPNRNRCAVCSAFTNGIHYGHWACWKCYKLCQNIALRKTKPPTKCESPLQKCAISNLMCRFCKFSQITAIGMMQNATAPPDSRPTKVRGKRKPNSTYVPRKPRKRAKRDRR